VSPQNSGLPIQEIWVASSNAKKKVELLRLLEPLGIRVRSMSEAPEPIEIIEDRDSFAGNAEKKAVTLAKAVRGCAIGDDSGICVDALDGGPGIYSARFAGEDATDEDRNQLLLDKLNDLPPEKRGARFVCHICLADPAGEVLARIEENCEGEILFAVRGDGGFGYDPLFRPAEGKDERCFGEYSAEEKDAISHRGKALRGLRSFLTQS
jgi:XTP/dITP diphosphohydrolase